MAKTYTITLEVEVKMTSPPRPASRYEPAEGPELEIDTISIEGGTETIDTLYKKYKETARGVPDSYDQFFANAIYSQILDQAYNDDWSDDTDDYDPTP